MGYHIDFVWKSTSFDRMRTALHTFRQYSASISGYLYHLLLGHEVEPATLKLHVTKKGFSVPNLPELNHSQVWCRSGWGRGRGGGERGGGGRGLGSTTRRCGARVEGAKERAAS